MDFSPIGSIYEMERESGVNYLTSWEDLKAENLPELQRLREDVFDYLNTVFGVNESQLNPDVDFQFHTAHALRNPVVTGERGHYMSLHLQVGVNYFWSVSCLSRFRSLDLPAQ